MKISCIYNMPSGLLHGYACVKSFMVPKCMWQVLSSKCQNYVYVKRACLSTKYYLGHENTVNGNKVLPYCEALGHM